MFGSFLSLIVRLGADTSGFSKGTKSVVRETEGLSSRLVRAFRGVAAATAGIFSTAALSAATRKVIEYASKVNDLSSTWGVSKSRIQEYNYIAGQSGTATERLIAAQKELAKARAEAMADPGSKAARAFEGFGISSKELAAIDKADDLMLRLSDAIKGVELDLNSLPVVLELIGQRNSEVLPALQAGLRESAKAARDLGLVMGDEAIAKLDDMGDRMDMLKQKLTVGLGPVVVAIGQKILEVIAGIRLMAVGFATFNDKFVRALAKTRDPVGAFKHAARAAEGAILKEAIQQEIESKIVADAQEKKKRQFTVDDLTRATEAATPATRRGGGGGIPQLEGPARLGLFLGGRNDPLVDINRQQLQELKALNKAVQRLSMPTDVNSYFSR